MNLLFPTKNIELKLGETITFNQVTGKLDASRIEGDLPAEQSSYDNTESGLEATNVQDAIDELANKTPENIYTKEETDDKFATKTALQTVSEAIPTKTSELINDSEFATMQAVEQALPELAEPVVEALVPTVIGNDYYNKTQTNAIIGEVKTGIGFDENIISKFVSKNFILGKTWTQGAMLDINKWSEMVINSATNRVNMIVTLDVDVSAIHIECATGYKYQFAFFDSSNVVQAYQKSWQTTSNDVYSASSFHTLRLMVAKTDDSDLSDASWALSIYDSSVGSIAGAMSTKYGILLVNNSSEYSLEINTTAKTIKVNNSYLLSHKFQRQTITGSTISYDIGNATASKALVLDTTDNTLKVVYCLDGNVSPKFDAEKHLVIAYFMANTILANGYINTLCSYNIDDKFYGNIPRKTSGGSDQAVNAKLRVCSYNLGMYTMGYSSNPVTAEMQPDIIAHARAFFSKYDCDVLGLQENRTNLYDVTVNNAIYNYLYTHSEDVANWTCLKTRREFISSGHGTFTAEGRDYTYGTININGIDIFLMSVHFSLTPENRASDWSQLLSILADKPYFIVFGDFNAGNGGGDAQTEFNNAISRGYHVANGGYLGLMQTVGGMVRYYDNIITSANIIIGNSYVPDVYASMDSDHLPIIAELEVT